MEPELDKRKFYSLYSPGPAPLCLREAKRLVGSCQGSQGDEGGRQVSWPTLQFIQGTAEPSQQVGKVGGQSFQIPVVALFGHPEEVVNEHPWGWMIPKEPCLHY